MFNKLCHLVRIILFVLTFTILIHYSCTFINITNETPFVDLFYGNADVAVQ